MSTITCQLFNHSDSVISELSLCIEPLPPFLQCCTILRERGSFSFNSPFSNISLGNFYPLEFCTLTFEWLEEDGSLSKDDVLLFLTLKSPVIPSTHLKDFIAINFLNV